ncbi:olfactory receptor 5AP2-like [Ambystoma mexicanum]|uniref:olfactory receptor 5AP2-like n=1 Tax=Ambystoma mexicanum TaxID=8296 RepID=UPI0037E8BF15
MGPGNDSIVTEFIMIGLTNDPHLQVLAFIILLPVYIFALIGNISILVIVQCNVHLHTPMYFFLSQLSFLDIVYSSVISPKMLVDLLSDRRTISFNGCLTQIYFFAACGSTEFILLAAMAFDRYVAICNPLVYTLIVTKGVCVRLVLWSYIGGFLYSLIHAGCLLRLSFCGPNVMNHFVCDYPVLLKLSCTDIYVNDLVRFVFASLVVLSSLVVILISYAFILIAILRIRTTAGRRRACSTCISHFTCVFLFYGTVLFMELRPNSSSSEEQDKVVAVISTVLIPALNPLIYSLRNQEVKEVLRKILNQKKGYH